MQLPDPIFDLSVLAYDATAQQLAALTILIVIVVIWIKKRSLKAQGRRMFYKRQKRGLLLEEPDDSPTQLEFDF